MVRMTHAYESPTKPDIQEGIHPSSLRWVSCARAFWGISVEKIKKVDTTQMDFGKKIHSAVETLTHNNETFRSKLVQLIIDALGLQSLDIRKDYWEFFPERYLEGYYPLNGPAQAGILVNGTIDLILVCHVRNLIIIIDYKAGSISQGDIIQIQAYMRLAELNISRLFLEDPSGFPKIYGALIPNFRTTQPINELYIINPHTKPINQDDDHAVYKAHRHLETISRQLPWYTTSVSKVNPTHDVGEVCLFCPQPMFPCHAVLYDLSDKIHKSLLQSNKNVANLVWGSAVTRRITDILLDRLKKIKGENPDVPLTGETYQLTDTLTTRLSRKITGEEWILLSKNWFSYNVALSYLPLSASSLKKAILDYPLNQSLKEFSDEVLKTIAVHKLQKRKHLDNKLVNLYDARETKRATETREAP